MWRFTRLRGSILVTPEAVTLDFHDTLFQCDDWFTLEVEMLLPSFLGWWSHQANRPVSDRLVEEARLRYRRLRREIIESGVERDATRCVYEVCLEHDLEVSRAEVETGLETLMAQALQSAEPMPGSVELVADLRGRGIRLAVISNAVYHTFIEWALERHGLLDAFEVITSSASAGFYKSRPEIYLATLSQLGVAPQRAVHVGDSYEYDVLGAGRAGMRTVWYTPVGQTMPECRADLVVSSLAGLGARIACMAFAAD